MTKKSGYRRCPGMTAFLLIAMLAVAAPSSPARADEFVAPSFANLVKMLVRFGALDISKDENLDSYAMVEECKLYNHFYGNDFEWRKVQAAMRKSIRQDISSFPTGIDYDAVLQLDRYDFREKMYRFVDRSSLNGVDYFTLDAGNDGKCENKEEKILPKEYRLVLDQPLIMAGIPMSEDNGKTLLARMQESGNNKRLVFVRFNMRVSFIARLMRQKDNYGKLIGELKQDANSISTRIDARLASIDFYEDEERTKMIYSYRP